MPIGRDARQPLLTAECGVRVLGWAPPACEGVVTRPDSDSGHGGSIPPMLTNGVEPRGAAPGLGPGFGRFDTCYPDQRIVAKSGKAHGWGP